MIDTAKNDDILLSQVLYYKQLNYSLEYLAKNRIKQDLEKKDTLLRQKYCKGYLGYTIHCRRSTTIITEWGKVEINRTIFKYFDSYKNKYSYVALLDKQIGRRPYERVCFDLKLKILKELATGKRGKDIQDKYKFAGISLMTISNVIRKTNLTDYYDYFFNVKKPQNVEGDYLYVGLDDTYLNVFSNENKAMKIKIRVAFIHTGIDKFKSSSNHNYLENKRIFLDIHTPGSDTKSSTDAYYLKLIKFIKNNFNISNKKIILMGDGALWIKELACKLQAKYVLDEFHLKNTIRKLFPYRRNPKIKLTESEEERKSIYLDLCKLLKENNYDRVMCYLTSLCNKHSISKYRFLDKKKKEILKFRYYLRSNWEGIKRYSEKFYIGSCTEAQISHNVKALLGFGSKAYSINSLKNMLIMKMAKVNQWNILDLLLDRHNKELKTELDYFKQNLWITNNFAYPKTALHDNTINN